MFLQGYVGQPTLQSMGPGTPFTLRGGQLSDLIVSELQGKYYEQTYRGNVFCNGCTTTALTANTISLTATTTPILGVWNPSTSPVNLVPLYAVLNQNLQVGAVAYAGAFVWASQVNQSALTLGTAPINRKNWSAIGSQAKGLSFIALTGLAVNLTIMGGAAFSGLSTAEPGTAVSAVNPPQIEYFDGSIIVPPGGILALLNTNSTTYSVYGNLVWEEVPL